MNLGIGAGNELAFAVVYVDFDQQRARGWIDGPGRAHDLALETSAPGYSPKVSLAIDAGLRSQENRSAAR